MNQPTGVQEALLADCRRDPVGADQGTDRQQRQRALDVLTIYHAGTSA
jgi:hypothetical protein